MDLKRTSTHSPGLVGTFNDRNYEISFSDSLFWVKLYGLPSRFLNLASAKELAGMFGRFSSFFESYGEVLMMKVEVDTLEALRAGFFLDRDKLHPLWIQAKYDNLGRMCHKCGVLDHKEEKHSLTKRVTSQLLILRRLICMWMDKNAIQEVRIRRGNFFRLSCG